MPGIRSFARVRGTNVNTAFPRTTSPAFVYTDFPYETSSVNWGDNGGFISLVEAQCIIPAPYRVPHNQRDESKNPNVSKDVKTYPFVAWSTISGDAKPSYAYNYPYLFSEIAIETFDDQSATAELGAKIDCQGFSFLYRRTDDADQNLAGGEAPSDATDDGTVNEGNFEVRWMSGEGEDAAGYSLNFKGDGTLLLQHYDPSKKTYTPIKTVDGGDDVGKALWGNYATDNQYTVIEVLLAGGKMFLYVGSQDIPVIIPEARIGADGVPIAKFNRIEVKSTSQKTIYFSVHPSKFYASTTFDSTQISIGFRSDDNPDYQVIPAGGWAGLYAADGVNTFISPTDDENSLKGPVVQYRLHLELPATGVYKKVSYADFAPGVHAVHLHWSRGPLVAGTDVPITLYPEQVVVNQRFDTDSLQIRAGATLHFNNWNAFWGNWSQRSGQVAIEIALTRTIADGSTPDPVVSFTGIGHTSGQVDSSRGASFFTMQCEDRVRQLEAPRWALPWFDGMNSLWVIAFLAQLGGVTIEQMRFANFVPDNPYDDWGDPSSGTLGAYFLPVGYFSSNLTRFSGESLWTVMSKIAYSIGYMLFFDAYGFLNFNKFWLPVFDNPAAFPVKRTFYESDAESGEQFAGGAEGCWSLTSHKSMDTVRNQAIVVGINIFSPAWEPIVMNIRDQRSILDPTSSNFLGYIQPVVWADSQFGDPDFAWQAAKSLIKFLRMPERRITFQTWFQPDIFPLDCVMVKSLHAGTIGIKFMVTEVSHALDQHEPVGKTTITGMAMSILDPLLDDFGYPIE